jgi:hypothetical protein
MTTRKELYKIMKSLNFTHTQILRMKNDRMKKIIEEHSMPMLPRTKPPKGHFVNGKFYPYPTIPVPTPPTLKKIYTTDMFIDFYDILSKHKIFENSFGIIYDKKRNKLNITLGMKYHTKKDNLLYNDIENLLKKYKILNNGLKFYDYFQVEARNGFMYFHCDGRIYKKKCVF